MKRFYLTSDVFTGHVMYEFNDAGLLSKVDMSKADLSQDQQVFILRNQPVDIAGLEEMKAKSTNIKISEHQQEVTFEMFWNRYNEKIRSSRKKALIRWNRMSQADRNLAYFFIQRYEQSIPQGVAKKYAETYLNAELWNN